MQLNRIREDILVLEVFAHSLLRADGVNEPSVCIRNDGQLRPDIMQHCNGTNHWVVHSDPAELLLEILDPKPLGVNDTHSMIHQIRPHRKLFVQFGPCSLQSFYQFRDVRLKITSLPVPHAYI